MRRLLWLGAALLLTGCGGGREDQAVEACAAAVSERLADKTFKLDRADMAAKSKAEGSDVFAIQSVVVFDAGLPSESRQTFDCRARLAGDRASVISLNFNW
jgi:hypothetical protein